jgi:hypothetical protein
MHAGRVGFPARGRPGSGADGRHPRCGGPPGLGRLLLEVFAGPVPLMAGAAAAGDPIAVLPALFHLMWRHSLTADLAARLTAETLVVAGAAAGGGR